VTTPARGGVLAGVTVLEFAGLGPAPFAAMMLADHGARVIRIDRPAKGARPGAAAAGDLDRLTDRRADLLARGRESIALDIKQPAAREIVLRLLDRCDALVEGFRPGVMEALGLGPDTCLARRKALVYARVTGWGQSGPLAHAAGHDINYIALSGALGMVARAGQPPVPSSGLIGDFGGGGMLAAFGVVSALLHARATGCGQVVDASVLEGSALLTTLLQGWRGHGLLGDEPGSNMGDGGAPFFDTYACADGRYIAIGAIEPPFYALLRQRCGLDDPLFDDQWNRGAWPTQKARLAALFGQRTRDEWCALLEGSDACFAPVLSLAEAPQHPHAMARHSFVTVDHITQPAPAPRFSASPPPASTGTGTIGAQTMALLDEIGCDGLQVEALVTSGAAWAPTQAHGNR
jgi:alpha-methylacyl-CoA racemase